MGNYKLTTFLTVSRLTGAAGGKNLGIPPQTISRWILEQERIEQNPSEKPSSIPVASEEVKALRRQVRRLEMERDILKKATAFFARESL